MSGKSVGTLIGIWLLIAVIVYTAVAGITIGSFKISSVPESIKLGLDIEGGVVLVYEADIESIEKENGKKMTAKEIKALMSQVKSVMENRINAMGLTEPKIAVSGERRLRIELPGVADANEAIKKVGQMAKLEFALVDQGKRVTEGMEYDESYGKVMMDGKHIKDSQYVSDSHGLPAVSLAFDSEGAKIFADMTRTAGNNGGMQIAIILDNKVISAPNASFEIADGKAQITGNYSIPEATTLSALIRGGALPVEMKEVQTSVIGPTLGKDSLKNAITAAKIGFILVMLFMIAYYRMPGVIASISLVLYATLLLVVMIGLKATLTLPGVAGIVLSVGMAVDANVIIFERIREDIREGKTIRASVVSGFSKAMRTILDSNITTIIAAIVLYFIGEGPIRGFAVTLMIGIATSMFTAIVVTRSQMMQVISFDKLNKVSFYGSRKGVKS